MPIKAGDDLYADLKATTTLMIEVNTAAAKLVSTK
jgi:hypothetical protein